MRNMNYVTTPKTLCWDCEKAVGGCRWSKYLEPVEGWKAEPTVKRQYKGEPLRSVIVHECPECHGSIDRWDHFCRHCGQAIEG